LVSYVIIVLQSVTSVHGLKERFRGDICNEGSQKRENQNTKSKESYDGGMTDLVACKK
jgi:hypothetical protein